jgi:hypothetical protein
MSFATIVLKIDFLDSFAVDEGGETYGFSV